MSDRLIYDTNMNTIEGWMSPMELTILFDLAKNMRSIVEIGSWIGRSTHALLSGCPGTVYAIDHFKGSPKERCSTHVKAKDGRIYEEFMQNVGHFPNLEVMKMDSRSASRLINIVDMVFIDGAHDYDSVRTDLLCWSGKALKVLCGHDCCDEGVIKALEDVGIYYYGIGGTALWIQKRWR